MNTKGTTTVNKLFAEFGMRMAGGALDCAAAIAATVVIQNELFDYLGLGFIDQRLTLFSVLVLYFAFFWSSPLRATPAQLLFAMRVVDESGETLDFRRALIRSVSLIGMLLAMTTIFRMPSSPWFGLVALLGFILWFLAALTPNRQAVHDFLAGSIVVNKFALKSPDRFEQLRAHVSDDDPATRRHRRPSVLTIIGSLLVLGIPMVVLFIAAPIPHERDLRARTSYAVSRVGELKVAVAEYQIENSRWPNSDSDVSVERKVDFPDGGYYELEDAGKIRIRFTVTPELMKGSLVLIPRLTEEGITWDCHADGDIERTYLPAMCRD